MRYSAYFFLLLFFCSFIMNAQTTVQTDTFSTKKGTLQISFIGHGSLMLNYHGTIIHIDPWSKLTDYSKLPKADIILITHHHFDHLDSAAIAQISKTGTSLIVTHDVFDILKKGIIMKNGDKKAVKSVGIEAVPAYNTTADRDKYHPKGRDNGYILTLGGKRVYIAGDTEDTPEMDTLKNIDIAFLPMNQPYTMLPEQVAAATNHFNPKVLYPYHYGETDVQLLQKLLAGNKTTELRIRAMK